MKKFLKFFSKIKSHLRHDPLIAIIAIIILISIILCLVTGNKQDLLAGLSIIALFAALTKDSGTRRVITED